MWRVIVIAVLAGLAGLATSIFTIDRRGRVAARLQGSFGTRAFERAIEAALR